MNKIAYANFTILGEDVKKIDNFFYGYDFDDEIESCREIANILNISQNKIGAITGIEYSEEYNTFVLEIIKN